MVAPSNEPMSNHGFLELWCDGRPPPPPVATTTTSRPNATAEVENGDDGDGSTESTMERERGPSGGRARARRVVWLRLHQRGSLGWERRARRSTIGAPVRLRHLRHGTGQWPPPSAATSHLTPVLRRRQPVASSSTSANVLRAAPPCQCGLQVVGARQPSCEDGTGAPDTPQTLPLRQIGPYVTAYQ